MVDMAMKVEPPSSVPTLGTLLELLAKCISNWANDMKLYVFELGASLHLFHNTLLWDYQANKD